MENKKISFGFNKITKKVDKKPISNKAVQLIDCLEGQSIKIRGSQNEVEDKPLVIALKDSSKNLLDRIKETRQKNLVKTEIKEEVERPDSELTIDELAARELLRDAQNRNNNLVPSTKIFSLPVADDKFVAEGEPEPTLDDYENVPVNDYGMAMLRGMGWKEGTAIGKDPSKTVPLLDPELRPRGLGLGADKLVGASKKEQVVDKDGKELLIVKGAYAKIIAGSHKGQYCQIQGFDDQSCRIIVKTAQQNMILSLQEFLVIPVTKEEYAIGSKVINNAKYEEYKSKSDEKLRENSNHHSEQDDQKLRNNSDSGGSYHKEHRRESKKSSHKSKTRSRSYSESSDSDDQQLRRKESKKNNKSRDRSRSRSESDESNNYKRESKKSSHKSRDRSSSSDSEESNNHKKYRKESKKHSHKSRDNPSHSRHKSSKKSKSCKRSRSKDRSRHRR